MADIRINKQNLKVHFQYSWWKYLVALAISALGMSMIFDMTEYRPPEEKKTELYFMNGYIEAERLADDLWPLLLEECPDQEELTGADINLLSDDAYVRMQYSTYIAARQGDVLVLPTSEYRSLASSEGADEIFVDLTPYIEAGIIDPDGIDLSVGKATKADGSTGIYAIPTDSLKGFSRYLANPEDGLLTVIGYGGNLDTAAHLVGIMLRELSK